MIDLTLEGVHCLVEGVHRLVKDEQFKYTKPKCTQYQPEGSADID